MAFSWPFEMHSGNDATLSANSRVEIAGADLGAQESTRNVEANRTIHDGRLNPPLESTGLVRAASFSSDSPHASGSGAAADGRLRRWGRVRKPLERHLLHRSEEH